MSTMTIAIGMVANDGIVLCADTQQTISGYIKTYDGKVALHCYKTPEIAMAIAGAGTEDYIKTATQLLSREPPSGQNIFEIEASLRETLLKFFDDHLARWAYFSERERPTVELLIGVTGKNLYPRLFHYSGTAFHETRNKAIGNGVLLADNLLKECRNATYTVEQLASIGIYIVSKVKRGVDGCGGSTHIVGLRKGFDFALTDDKEIKQLEAEIEQLEQSTRKELMGALTGKRFHLSWQSEYRKDKAKQLTAQKSEQP